MQNKLTGHKTAVHTATTDTYHAVKTVYLNKDIAMKSVIDYATQYRQADYEPMTKQYFQGVVSTIAERIYYAMNWIVPNQTFNGALCQICFKDFVSNDFISAW